jgi:Raf kinase inhibitor-like YbhB/YbcL family protein
MKSPLSALQVRRMLLMASLTLCSGLVLWGGQQSTPPAGTDLRLTASSFRANGEIPARFSCDGDDTSPALSWGDPPAGTRSFALAMVDPDHAGGNAIHWIIYDLPASTRELPEDVPQGPDAAGGHQGTNSFGNTGYKGPCPPPGNGHRYVFHLFALDATLGLQHPNVHDLESAMKGHILASGEIVGMFRR